MVSRLTPGISAVREHIEFVYPATYMTILSGEPRHCFENRFNLYV